MTKPTKWHVRPAKTQICLGFCPVWSESLLSAWRKLGSLATQWAHSKDSDQTGQMPRLIWDFAGRTVILLVLSWGSSNDEWNGDSNWQNSLLVWTKLGIRLFLGREVSSRLRWQKSLLVDKLALNRSNSLYLFGAFQRPSKWKISSSL